MLTSPDGTMFVSGDQKGGDHVVEVKPEKEVRSQFLAVQFASFEF